MKGSKTRTGKHNKPRFEVADIIATYGRQYRQNHPVSFAQHRILTDIEWCRTLHMGGHSSKCDQCDYVDISYNSCRNRHCPKCFPLVQRKHVAPNVNP